MEKKEEVTDGLVVAAKSAAAGIRSAMSAGKELDAAVSDIQKLGVAEVKARQAYKRKQRVVHGDTTIMTAFAEWRRLKEIKDAEDQLKEQLIERYGKDVAEREWADIQKIKERQMKEIKDGKDELGRDLKKLRDLKITCFILSFILVSTYYIFKGHL